MESLYGVPVVVEEMLEPGASMILGNNARGDLRVFVHPTVAYAMEAAAEAGELERMHDPEVMVAASIRWQADVIERRARNALTNIDALMARQDWVREQRRNDALLATRLEHLRLFVHHGRQHRWTRDMLRRTATCAGCKIGITEESAYRLGIELGDDYGKPTGRLSILVGDEWHEVKGITQVGFTREDGAR